MKLLLPFAFMLMFAAAAFAEDPRWNLTLRDTPFHVGDTVHKDMRNPKPDGPKFVATFEIPDSIPVTFARSFQVDIAVTHLISSTDKRFRADIKEGKLLARLLVNGQQQIVLNEAARGRQAANKTNTISVQVSGKAFRPGRNELEIVAGGRMNDFDDFEIQRVVISTLRPPK